jgi:hypothetical protein
MMVLTETNVNNMNNLTHKYELINIFGWNYSHYSN